MKRNAMRHSSFKKYYMFIIAFGILLIYLFFISGKWSSINFSHKLRSYTRNRYIYNSRKIIDVPAADVNVELENNSSIAENDGLYEEYISDENTNHQFRDKKSRPWYFAGGKRYPNQTKVSKKTGKRIARVLPEEDNPSNDRIINQLMFVPPNANKPKLILLYGGWHSFWVEADQDLFSECPVSTCVATVNRAQADRADMIMFQRWYTTPTIAGPPNQLYLIHFLESPVHTQIVRYPDVFNWTATYRHDSTIPVPYGKWVYYDPNVNQMEQSENYAKGKTKKVAWFASNCAAKNNRLSYAHELAKYIEVDIYGKCGKLKCPRATESECLDMLKTDYKFYLAFENSNCKEYITEKLYKNALGYNVLPIVMGARPEDYEKYAPLKSYIHVEDFESPKELAEYLRELDQDDELYNSYFKWKGTGEMIDRKFWCRLCAMLHDDYAISKRLWHSEINEWWHEPNSCTTGYWRDTLKETP